MLSHRTLLPAVVLLFLFVARPLRAQTPEWIWGSSTTETETRYFRKSLTVSAPSNRGILAVACDNEAEVFLDGKRVARNNDWNQATFATIASGLTPGDHLLTITAKNNGGPAGLLVRLELIAASDSRRFIVTDSTWETSADGNSNWVKAK